MNDEPELDQTEIQFALRAELLEEARDIAEGRSHKAPTRLHLWAILSALDGGSLAPPPTVYGQMLLPLERLH